MHVVPYGRCSADLALVRARVPALRIPDLQGPVLRVRRVNGREPLVGCVREPVHRQQVNAAMPYPRHLQQ